MASQLRRLSGLFRMPHAEQKEEEDVEVVELFSMETTSQATESESAVQGHSDEHGDKGERKRRQEEPLRVGVSELSSSSDVAIAGDVNLQTPPTKKRRILSQSIAALETLIEVVADEEEVLSTRLEYCSNIWRFVREMHSRDVVDFVRQRSSSVVQIIETLLHTGYFPLQQLCFMTVSAILHQLHRRDTEALAAFIVACNQYLGDTDVDLLDLLPFRETIPWHDPRVARQRIVQINRRTGLCHSFRVTRCWVSPSGKKELAHIRVNKWVDIGGTTTTFYWRDENDLVVVNVPHSCVEDVEIERENCILYIWTKHIDRLKGVRLLAFASSQQEFPGLVKALVGVEVEGYTGQPAFRGDAEFGSPIQTLKTSSTLFLAGESLPESPATTMDDTAQIDDSFEADDSFAYEEPDDSASPPRQTDSIETLNSELTSRLEAANRHAADSLESLHQRLDSSREAITDSFSRVSSAHLESNHEIGKQEYQLRETVDSLQQKRILGVPHAELVVEASISRAKTEAIEHLDDTLNYAAENVMQHDSDFIFTSASFVLLLVVVLPWVLFAALHGGSDLASVRQLANDAGLVLAGMLRKLSA